MFGDIKFIPMLILGAFVVVPFWKIFDKAGFPPALSLLMVIPVVNVILVYYLAFTKWPRQAASGGSQGDHPISSNR
jgi:hypothetical protein